jgi:hypothetical protein
MYTHVSKKCKNNNIKGGKEKLPPHTNPTK